MSETYKGCVRKSADKKLTGRKDTTLLAQLRAGHCLDYCKHRIDEKKSTTFPACKEEEETTKHWLSCPATIRTREVNLDTLSALPEKILAYAEETLLKRR